MDESKRDQYDNLATVNKYLINMIYTNKENFIKADDNNPIVDYIIAYDTFASDKVTLYNLLVRLGGVGLFNRDDDSIVNYMYNVLLLYIKADNKAASGLPSVRDFFRLEQKDFLNFMSKHYPDVDVNSNYVFFYNQRLLYLLKLYNN